MDWHCEGVLDFQAKRLISFLYVINSITHAHALHSSWSSGNTGSEGLAAGFVEQTGKLFETYDANLHFESICREEKRSFRGRK